MDKARTEKGGSVKLFLAAVGKRYRIQRAYLYGSQARGNAKEWSDIDIAIVSPDFDTANLFDERIQLMRIAAEIDDRIEPHPFSPEDFESICPLAHEIKRFGIQMA